MSGCLVYTEVNCIGCVVPAVGEDAGTECATTNTVRGTAQVAALMLQLLYIELAVSCSYTVLW